MDYLNEYPIYLKDFDIVKNDIITDSLFDNPNYFSDSHEIEIENFKLIVNISSYDIGIKGFCKYSDDLKFKIFIAISRYFEAGPYASFEFYYPCCPSSNEYTGRSKKKKSFHINFDKAPPFEPQDDVFHQLSKSFNLLLEELVSQNFILSPSKQKSARSVVR